MNAERYRLYEEYMRRCMGDSAHDAGHVYRVLHAALLMAGPERSVNQEVLITAALLHDVGREEQFRTGENHARVGARMAHAFLTEHGADEAFAGHVADCIRTHRFRSDDPPASIEAKLLYDADKLDVSGVTGIARTLLYQGHVGQPVYSVGPDGAVLSGEEKIPSFYSEYRHKLSGISARFLTAEGRKMAARRCGAADRCYEALCAEVAAGESGSAWRMLPRTAAARQRRVFNIALMLAGDSGKVSGNALVALVMQDERSADAGAAGRAVRDAALLDDLGMLGIAQRLMEMGRAGRSMSTLPDEPWQMTDFSTAQARGIAKVRAAAAREFLEELRMEMSEVREAGEQRLREILK